MKASLSATLGILAAAAAFAGAAENGGSPPAAAAKRPNLIFITADQLRADALGCNGGRIAHTPNIDKLAARGVSFNYAYTAAPLCMPSRNSWITGRWPHQTGICGNERPPLRPDQRAWCFTHQLQAAGYRTLMVGKNHFFDYYGWRGFDYTTLAPQFAQYGFDKVVQVLDLNESDHNGDDYTAWLAKRGSLDAYRKIARDVQVKSFYTQVGKTTLQPQELPLKPEETPDGWIAGRALEMIEGHDASRPLFLWVSFIGPHPPYVAPAEYLDRYKDVKLNPRVRAYYARISEIDDYIGRMMDALERRGLLDNTLVIFSADHGDMLGERGIWDKRWFYDPSAKVPLIVAGPGFGEKRANEQTADKGGKELVSSLDVSMTFLRAAGVPPVRDAVPLSGRPLQDVVRHEPGALRDAVFSELGTSAMIRTARWKMWFDPEEGGVLALYNMRDDPAEKDNLSEKPEYAEVRADLTSRLLAWMRETTTYTELKEYHRVQKVISGPSY